jgi:hypothetical protein
MRKPRLSLPQRREVNVAAFGIVPAILGQTKVAYVTKFTSVEVGSVETG